MTGEGFFYEVRHNGRWWPRWSAEAPTVKNGRIHTNGLGPGDPVRGVTPIGIHRPRATLEQLREVYSQDGRFRSMAGKGEPT